MKQPKFRVRRHPKVSSTMVGSDLNSVAKKLVRDKAQALLAYIRLSWKTCQGQGGAMPY